ncbi:methyltransferase domain-containing protein [Quadrisphaera sp. DSM 44207]|uniref:methyltransferase domain-containing protein n=1 Tax=Quadrisphaera sp. DSM 44207 TaxID=1881057 RepID=UPI0008841AE7|nr:methyltransferase domain-containing protein [Quadrisphaera sp. DSM 44207]SDQ73886.1 Methyltransferase domain-containing protein [Quadrisphaera sp. DSM 44207]
MSPFEIHGTTPARAGSIGPVLVSARSFAEYSAMFALTEQDLTDLAASRRRVLDCPGGAAGFTAGAAARGVDATAVDPAYPGAEPDAASRAAALAALGAHAVQEAMRGNAFVRAHAHRYVWTWFPDPADHLRQRVAAARAFTADARAHPERYLPGALPSLPFPDSSFDLVLSSHLLFTYADRLDEAFHLAALRELVRVAAGQVRVFPLLQHADGMRYPHLDRLLSALAGSGIDAQVRSTGGYELQRGGGELLVLARGGA